MSIRRLAIVNRGEAAVRALTAVAELNRDARMPAITTIVLYTEPDAGSLFVRLADEAVRLDSVDHAAPPDNRTSAYLDEERVIRALTAAHADAAWPGWGFLAERASFADACSAAGIVFVGPDGATMRLLGDKMAAKQLAERVGVPVIPWSGGPVTDAGHAASCARRLGYPLLLKAAAGGGGRGIRVVPSADAMPAALASARAEAELAFGDSAVFCEKLVPRARHIEVQIIADSAGTIWPAGIRDCSVQRHNQKVIEETVEALDQEDDIRAAAVRIAEAAGYRNAGTLEFLLDPDSGRFWFMEVNPRLQVEHPVTEAACGLDLVKLQLKVAAGGLLEGCPPAQHGHAVEARLCAEDPEKGFVPAPGRIVTWRPPVGPGIRVDCGIAEGDVVPADFDSMIAKVVAWGHDRHEALSRLRHALASTVLLIEGGTTNRAFLLTLLRQPELRAGPVDNRWLDHQMAADGHLPDPNPLAVAVAAVESCDMDHIGVLADFRAGAQRGNPLLPRQSGHRVTIRYRDERYRLTVYRAGPDDYRIACAENAVMLRILERAGSQRRIECGGAVHRVTVAGHGSSFVIDIDQEFSHRVYREEGGVVRAAFPALVTAVKVAEGDEVRPGDPLLVLESMKMESTVSASYGGRVTGLEVTAGTQVEAGDPLLGICESGGQDSCEAVFAGFGDSHGDRDVYDTLTKYLLGFDPVPAVTKDLLAAQRALGSLRSPGDPDLLAAERDLIALFTDVNALYQPQPGQDSSRQGSPREYLLGYLQWLDPEQAGLPADFRTLLSAVLARYGVTGLDQNPRLKEAVFWMFRSFRRTSDLVPAVTTVLERWLQQSSTLPHDQETQVLIDRLIAAVQPRHPTVSELARDVRFRLFDEPAYERMLAGVYAEAQGHLDALAADPRRPGRDKLIEQLVTCPQPLRSLLVSMWRKAEPGLQGVVLEVYMRRYYRRRELGHVHVRSTEHGLAGCADYHEDGLPCRLLVTYSPFSALSSALAGIAAAGECGRQITIDAVCWRKGELLTADEAADEVSRLLAIVPPGQQVHRVNVTVSTDGPGPEHLRTLLCSFTRRSDGFAEERLYRNVHPMLAERIELGRLSGFTLERLRSAEDVYLFHGVARDNPEDARLFAFAEVRDLTAVRDPSGHVVSIPQLERIGLQALAGMRLALGAMPQARRPHLNRIRLYVRPPFRLPRSSWIPLVRRFAPLGAGIELDEIRLAVRVPRGGKFRETDLRITGLDDGEIRVSEIPSRREPVESITEQQRKVLQARRYGAPYPYELITMIAPPRGTRSGFPPGRFTEYDLGADDILVPVRRPPGQHMAAVVTGVITNFTGVVPEGMSRVAILGDPTRHLGSLTEHECRRVMAAIDLAERLGIPVEWFAVSSGARIALDSGTENMDWVAAVLRRIIRFTQAGGEVNVVVTGINVGAQPYWNAEATMLMHTRGILIMTPASAMVLTGKRALDYSGGVSAEDNFGIGGVQQIMGPNGQAHYAAPTLAEACDILLRHYEFTYIVPGERAPRRVPTADPFERDVRTSPHPAVADSGFTQVGDIFSVVHNPDRKKPFDIRAVMRAVTDTDCEPLERWSRWANAGNAVVWDTRTGGIPVCLLGIESRQVSRRGWVPGDGPSAWTSGTLFPQSSRKIARAINAASGNRPVVVLANLSGFDGSPESMRRRQLEYGAEIGRAVANFEGPIVFLVISRYHGGAFVVFSKRLNDRMEVAAVEGSYASVIGGAPAAAVVFAREVTARTEKDPRVASLREQHAVQGPGERLHLRLHETYEAVRAEKLSEVAAEFDRIHSIERALAVGSIDRIISAGELRPYIISALERGIMREHGQ